MSTPDRERVMAECMLIERAMEGVTIIVCPECDGLGIRGKSLPSTCYVCGGYGESTTNELEVETDG